MTGFVYAIVAGDLVKCGWSRDPKKRATKVRTDNAGAELLGFVPATREQESELHSLLSPWRVVGEWFKREGAVLHFLSLLPPVPSKQDVFRIIEGDLQASFSTQRGLRLRLSRELGITHGAISQWRRVPVERVLDIERITGLPRHVLRPDIYPPPQEAAPSSPSSEAAA